MHLSMRPYIGYVQLTTFCCLSLYTAPMLVLKNTKLTSNPNQMLSNPYVTRCLSQNHFQGLKIFLIFDFSIIIQCIDWIYHVNPLWKDEIEFYSFKKNIGMVMWHNLHKNTIIKITFSKSLKRLNFYRKELDKLIWNHALHVKIGWLLRAWQPIQKGGVV